MDGEPISCVINDLITADDHLYMALDKMDPSDPYYTDLKEIRSKLRKIKSEIIFGKEEKSNG